MMKKQWKDITVGDVIVSRDGRKSVVLEIFPSGKTFLYSIWSSPGMFFPDEIDEIEGSETISRAERVGWVLEGAEKKWEPRRGRKDEYLKRGKG